MHARTLRIDCIHFRDKHCNERGCVNMIMHILFGYTLDRFNMFNDISYLVIFVFRIHLIRPVLAISLTVTRGNRRETRNSNEIAFLFQPSNIIKKKQNTFCVKARRTPTANESVRS